MRKILTLILLICLSASLMQAQVVIGGSIYGGGNAGDVKGSAKVTVYEGNLHAVFAGARMANVDGSAFVHLDGEHASNYILADYVYGGNDISGEIGTSNTLPTELTEYEENKINNSWNSFVRISTKTTTTGTGANAVVTEANDAQKIYIGQLFGGGNGYYDYEESTTGTGDEAVTTYTVKDKGDVVATSTNKLSEPELGKAYLEILGGSIVYAYGGGNNATITDSTVICLDNPSKVVSSIKDENGDELLTDARLKLMRINTELSQPTSDEFQIGRFFGGNNKAPMAIRPTWNLKRGLIRNLYSGGNEGAMTAPNGIHLALTSPNLKVDNVYGGCRMADVNPDKRDIVREQIEGIWFPAGYAARLFINDGDINNVYGGNDITGIVYGGNAVGIHCSIKGDVYGGGNGSYPYTDNAALKDNDLYGDLYYNPGASSVDSLNAFRPNAEQVSVRVTGYPITNAVGDTIGIKPTIIHGSIYVGGNSATLKNTRNANPHAELKIGSYVIADNVFLGNNGENMVKTSILEKMAGNATDNAGNEIKDKNGDAIDFSSIDLTDDDSFAAYMEGCALNLMPSVSFDDMNSGDPATYEDYSTYIGSFFCGGNVGSMTKSGTTTLDFTRKIVVFDKVVGGCNNAYVPASDLNAAYNGGIIGAPSERAEGAYIEKVGSDNKEFIKNRLVMNFNGLKLQPKRWRITEGTYTDPAVTDDDKLVANYPNEYLIWNTVDGDGNPTAPVTALTPDTGEETESSTAADMERRFKEGHIYGGCYNSGIVNGNVVINLNNSIVDRDLLFDEVLEDTLGEAILYGHEEGYKIKTRRSGVILGQQGMDVFGAALNVFGGGKGPGTEIWGSTTINLNAGYTFQIFGGSEEGVIGRPKTVTTTKGGSSSDYTFSYKIDDGSTDGITVTKTYGYDPRYSCYVNLAGANEGVSKRKDSSEAMAECEFMYGGGFFGPICGNTVINLGKGRIFNSFAGSCNADILGHTETYIGRQVKEGTTADMKYEYKNNFGKYIASESTYVPGFTWVRDIVYGGNDLGGRIMEMTPQSFKSRVRTTTTGDSFDVLGKIHNPNKIADPEVLTAGAYIEYLQGRADAIFGGCYGTYDFTEDRFRKYTYDDGRAKAGFYKPYLNNAFVNFRPTYTNENNVVKKVYGAGQGQSGEAARDSMQNRSYVLIDIPASYKDKYQALEVFGAGAWGGVGMGVTPSLLVDQKSGDTTVKGQPDKASAIIDLMRGTINAAYGASYKEGFTRRTVVNVPDGSTIKINKIFGGGYGIDDDGYKNAKPCDAYEAQVNYNSDKAIVTSAIYGGNNNYRRTLYGQVNISKPVYNGSTDLNGKPMTSTVYGAGFGVGTWAQYTEVNLLAGAEVYEVYGGGQMGKVLNKKSVDAWKEKAAATTTPEAERFTMDLSMGSYTDNGLNNALARTNADGSKHNTNVHIHKDAIINMYYILKNNGKYGYVGGYAYGGGLGNNSGGSGDVYGSSYIDLLGGTVKKDLYAAGTSGAVKNEYGIAKDDFDHDFIASANAYIEGGVARNVYGGGWEGSVGKHQGVTTTTTDPETGEEVTKTDVIAGDIKNDILGETHVVIGKKDGTGFYDGIPAIERNAYGGGEGGPVYGTTHLTLNNGYIGYVYDANGTNDPKTAIDERYLEKIHDETADKDSTLFDSGCLFGGGYIDNSSVDVTDVRMYGGFVRNSVFGGGEIAAIGRGAADETEDANGIANKIRKLTKIYKAGTTNVYLYDGHVMRHVFGGGRGYDNLGGVGHLYSDGYVFGRTGVNIYGGEVGTEEGMANGYGNVFGGGDVGYVYGSYMEGNNLFVGIKDGDRYDDKWEGYYFDYEVGEQAYTPGTKPDDDDPGWVKDGDEWILTEDCKVLVEPWCKVKTAVTINGHSYNPGDYVPTEDLHYLKNKSADSRWGNLDDKGIIIHNAVFAGGNVTSGSDQLYAEAKTVLGNATASIHDVYNRDLITIGTGHTGGLYGDGNLTFVDGYRGLNITNYGTDYYNISMEISIDAYRALPAREQAYYELRYSCLQECTDNEGKTYYPKDEDAGRSASTITADELTVLFEGTDKIINGKPNPDYWKEEGVCSRYAGRIMNTIQRADFCGVFGSRMVMQGARDRVVDQSDKTNYTINRVREVSLNKKTSVAGDIEAKHATHGNYFGIYSVVNYLGALTSDVDFYSERSTTNTGSIYQPTSSGQTFAQWKEAHKNDRTRNNATSHNQVALASGVFLELTTEKSTGKEVENKDWGLITGVIELDLINVQTGVGGGFVYAKNEHGVRSATNKHHITLTALNQGAATSADYTYDTNDDTKKEWETSGNFVHSTQTIIDDCYPESNRYHSTDYVKAHYWYIKGQVYVYDQYISAYTGAPSAYSKVEYLNLTVAAASHGAMTLVDVKPNRYAYYSYYKSPTENTKLTAESELEIGNKKFKLNDPISYWDWNLLTRAEKNLFVDSTYVTVARCKIGDTIYPADTVLLASEYKALRNAAVVRTDLEDYPVADYPNGVKAVELWGTNEEGQDVKLKDEAFDFVFRESNNMSHDKGYLLTYSVTNPKNWNDWYTLRSGAAADKIGKDVYDAKTKAEQDAYNNGPTYKPTANGLYGQRDYKVSNLIPETTYNDYQTMKTAHNQYIPASGQAVFDKAYVVKNTIAVGDRHLYKGATIAKTDFSESEWAAIESNVTDAYVCTSTIKLDDNVIIYATNVLTLAEIDAYKAAYASQASAIEDVVKPAYYCTAAGKYGGNYYDTDHNYRGLAAWSALSPEDRKKFEFNYDAFDLLIDPNYSRNELEKWQYDGKNFDTEAKAKTNKAGYSVTTPLDYKATFNGIATSATDPTLTSMTYTDKAGEEHTVAINDELDRETYESLPNEQHHYAAITVNKAEDGMTYFVVKKAFVRGETPYAVGQVISEEEKNSLGDDVSNITTLIFTDADDGETFYYCRENYEIGANGEGKAVTGLNVSGVQQTGSYADGQTVPQGLVISGDTYKDLPNRQLGFTIHGIAPIETSTLYVSQQSDIYDLSKEKIITVIYQYDYEESDESGLHITPVSERHVINIHVQFESGIPEVENISKPDIVIPGTEINIRTPNVKPGAFEITGGGWMLFERVEDTESHVNGIEFTPTSDPLYWYQDGYWLAYYAKTYLGKTFSNAVQVSVANYHNLAEVMSNDNKAHHMYIDNPDVKRDPKIYIKTQDGLNQLKNLFDLSVYSGSPAVDPTTGLITSGPFEGHKPLDEQVKAGQNLEFILQTDITVPSGSPAWTPIGDGTNCFAGKLHGDGYTISGLKPNTSAATAAEKTGSLFGQLCGKVFNLGVTGSFTGSGVADGGAGHVENCWVSTTGTTTGKAVFGGTDVVNSYYVTGQYSSANSGAIAKSAHAFYNGEVAYNLNGFYLNKRYYDHTAPDSSPVEYRFLDTTIDGTIPEDMSKAKYPASYAVYTPQLAVATGETLPKLGYVENRFYDGDYRYAGGDIPEGNDARVRTEKETVGTGDDAKQVDKTYYAPVWPDDYLFFGQALNYDHMDGNDGRDLRIHQDLPARIVKTSDRITTTTEGNRVYRAPAYMGSKDMSVAYFNPHAVFAQTKKGASAVVAYKGMTAIDFTGHNDDTWALGTVSSGSPAGAFYPPLLDDGGIQSIYFADLTRNILAYTGTSTAAATQTNTAVSEYLTDEACVETDAKYRTVAEWDSHSDNVHGHWVQLTDEGYRAQRDHLLVDKQDFNCPISYTFEAGKRMWYQRRPDRYVSLSKGWETVSLPFTAELVTTQDKGEITHFYDKSKTVDGETKIGHEYWLREYIGISNSVPSGSPAGAVTATCNYPGSGSADKTVQNTYLWDHYYSQNSQLDANSDTYQTFYKAERKYEDYAMLTRDKAYIVGFPGKTFYEFDLSGEWSSPTYPKNTAQPTPEPPGVQTITFASVSGTTIEVSDTEIAKATAQDGYCFMPNYMSKTPAVTYYTMHADGDKFVQPTGAAAGVVPFRPYFIAGSSTPAPASTIVFDDDNSSFAIGDDPDPSEGDVGQGGLTFSVGKRKISVTSSLRQETDVRIFNVSGQTIAAFTIDPDETIVTPVHVSGVYIIRAAGGRYTKKVTVK